MSLITLASEQMNPNSQSVYDFANDNQRWGLTQPFETVTLDHHQLWSRRKLLKNKRVILSMDKGLGKTILVLSLFEAEEVHKNNPGFTVLILCPEKGMGSYTRDIKKFPDWEGKIQLVYGNKASRESQWKNPTARYFICTYTTLLSDLGIRTNNKKTAELSTSIAPKWLLNNQVDAVVCDEFHRVMRRHSSKTFEALKKLFRYTEYLIPMSGSAVDKGPQDLFAVLQLCDQKLWSSYWKYAYTWCEIDDTGFGKTILGPRSDRMEKWRQAVAPYLIHVTSDMVSTMPEKRRDLMDVVLPDWQKKLHDSLRDQMFAETPDGDFIYAENTLTKLHKIRTALICPKVLNPEFGYGQGIEDIFDDACEGGATRYAIFTPFRAGIHLLAERLTARGARVWTLQGGIGLDEQTRRLDAWRESLGQSTADAPAIILSTIKYAESWEIPEARYGYLLGYEWSPEDNKQAEDRLRRLISVGITYIRYCRHVGAYDEDLVQMLLDKSANVRMMFSRAVVNKLKEMAYQKSTQ